MHRVTGRGESLASARFESWLAVPPWTSCLASLCLCFPGRDGEGTSLPQVTGQEEEPCHLGVGRGKGVLTAHSQWWGGWLLGSAVGGRAENPTWVGVNPVGI